MKREYKKNEFKIIRKNFFKKKNQTRNLQNKQIKEKEEKANNGII